MEFDECHVMNVLGNLKEDPMRITFTEHFLEQINRRNIPDMYVTDLLETGNPVEIKKIGKCPSRFELEYAPDDSNELHVTFDLFNHDSIILILAFVKNDEFDDLQDNLLEFECIYDSAFDLMDLHSRYGFRYGQTIEMEPGFNIDFDSCGYPVAVEIIRASKKFKLKQKTLSYAKLKGWIEIGPNMIRIRIEVSVRLTDVKTRVLENEVPNVYGIKTGRFKFDV